MHPAVVVFAICALVCAVAHAAILVSVAGRRTITVDPGVPRPRFVAEIVWALVPIIVLAFVLTATWARVRDHAVPKPAEVMKVAQ